MSLKFNTSLIRCIIGLWGEKAESWPNRAQLYGIERKIAMFIVISILGGGFASAWDVGSGVITITIVTRVHVYV